jgi:5,10-methylene-tetrahydrofolate dehydrogenase/methenyl tetrahydrofolate cyclohydrolase
MVLNINKVGNKSDSNIFIRNKIKTASSIGIETRYFRYNSDFNAKELLAKLDELNADGSVHGIINQLPFDTTLDVNHQDYLNRVLPCKDVDGLHTQNWLNLDRGCLTDVYIPCVARGCVELIKSTQLQIKGLRTVVVGTSQLVGKPIAALLRHEQALVTSCNKKTRDLVKACQEADCLVVAIGHAQYVKENFVKKGAIVIDVGINYGNK